MNSQPIKILLVEDEPRVRLIHEIFLKSIGCHVILATNSNEALHHIKQSCDLVMMDIDLPGISGIEVVEIYRKQEARNTRLPIIFLTAYQDEEITKKCLLVGADAVYYKPVTKEKLKHIINSTIL